jgi:aryl-alcohol dehydrogenase-like predicted oxidoreductase
MRYRELGRTGWKVSEIGFGAWAIGGTWGQVNEEEAVAALHQAIDSGVNFLDTADVYGDGRSERLIARVRKSRSEPVYVATKAGRRLNPHIADGYTRDNLSAFVARSLKNLETDCLDLLQLHCPPSELYERPEVFGVLDDLVAAGAIRHYGVSVEKVADAMKAIEYPGVQSVQIIFNMFRHRPADAFFAAAGARRVGVIARVPLASGLLTGKITRATRFADDDHRAFNRTGVRFDVGETFSGVELERGLAAVDEIRRIVPDGVAMAQLALRWILMFDAVTCAIPGARNPAQASGNAAASDLPPLGEEQMAAVRDVYDRFFRADVHQRW